MSISLADAKKHLNITHSDDDEIIQNALIPAAIKAAENYTGISIQQIAADSPPVYAIQLFDEWGDYLELEKTPVIEVQSIEYVDANGDTQTWSSADWELDTRSQKAIIYPRYGKSFPVARAQPMAITVTYDAGYESWPADISLAVLMMVSTIYKQREDLVVGETVAVNLPLTSRLLLNPYRVMAV